ncbi:hypothetical protein HaLaN_26497 [Haematococcus lacustris]|uniref:Uncharacterized protein n=1 Tax=Haematococcus lacustris TaxID=44745 RepID=A0A6A0A6B8_HAELA|nr:hypothetical protein HaLaN_26497 [Haematococcus lacustris]
MRPCAVVADATVARCAPAPSCRPAAAQGPEPAACWHPAVVSGPEPPGVGHPAAAAGPQPAGGGHHAAPADSGLAAAAGPCSAAAGRPGQGPMCWHPCLTVVVLQGLIQGLAAR